MLFSLEYNVGQKPSYTATPDKNKGD